jgi:hypothetical protein
MACIAQFRDLSTMDEACSQDERLGLHVEPGEPEIVMEVPEHRS